MKVENTYKDWFASLLGSAAMTYAGYGWHMEWITSKEAGIVAFIGFVLLFLRTRLTQVIGKGLEKVFDAVMKKIFGGTPPTAIILLVCLAISSISFAQGNKPVNTPEVRLLQKSDSAIISGVAQMRWDNINKNIRIGDGTSWSSFGKVGTTAYQIPFMASSGPKFSYDGDFSFNPTNYTFKVGNNVSVTNVTSNYNFLSGDGTALSGVSGSSVQWGALFGEASTIAVNETGRLVNNPFIIGGYLNAINLDAGAGSIYSPFILGTRNTITNNTAADLTGSMIIGYRSTNDGDMNLVMGFRGHATVNAKGGFVHGFSTTYTTLGNWTGTVEPVTVGGRHAVNISANSVAQTVGHGAYGDYSIILGGQDHDIPSTSPHSAIIGGNAIKARVSDPDQVYVPNLNIATTPLNDDALTQVLVRSATGQVKYRNASTLSVASDGSFSITPTCVTNCTSTGSAQTNYTRVENMVHLSGTLNIDATAAGSVTVVSINVPVGTNFTSVNDAHGTVTSVGVGYGTASPNTTSDLIELSVMPTDTNLNQYKFSIMYEVK